MFPMRKNYRRWINLASTFAILAAPTSLTEPVDETNKINLKAEVCDSIISLKIQNGEISEVPPQTEIEIYVFLDGKPTHGNNNYDIYTGLAYRGPIRNGEDVAVPRIESLFYWAGIFDIDSKPDGTLASTIPFDVYLGNVDVVYQFDPGNTLQEPDESDNIARWTVPFEVLHRYSASLGSDQGAMARLLSLEGRIESN